MRGAFSALRLVMRGYKWFGVICVDTWEAFVKELEQVRDYHVSSGQRANQPLLFRGQSDSRWGLDTTLDRSKRIGMRFGDYYKVISRSD
jgi:hypothetical protein